MTFLPLDRHITCINICVCVYVCICVYVSMHMCVCVRTYVCYTFTRLLCVCMYGICMYVCVYIYMYLWTYVYIYMYAYVYLCMYVCMYVCMMTDEFKSGGLHEKHGIPTWKLGTILLLHVWCFPSSKLLLHSASHNPSPRLKLIEITSFLCSPLNYLTFQSIISAFIDKKIRILLSVSSFH
jgi:hypothetical protein